MLGNVEAFCFFLLINPDTHHGFNDAEDDEREDEREAVNRDDPNDLRKETEVRTTEDSYSKCSPDAADSVHGDRADRIVDLDLVEEQDREHH